jgi:hypothetical protein
MRGVACACAVAVLPRLRSPAPIKESAASTWAKSEDFRDIAILPSISTASLEALLVVGRNVEALTTAFGWV